MKISDKDFSALTSLVLDAASQALSKSEFFKRILGLLIDCTGCSAIRAGLTAPGNSTCVMAVERQGNSLRFFFKDVETTLREEGAPAAARPGFAAWIPLEAREAGSGYLRFEPEAPDAFRREEIEFLERAVRVVSSALFQWHTAWSLRERVKELTCLHGIADILDAPEKTLEEVLGEIVEILPGGRMHADKASAAISFGGRSYTSKGFERSPRTQTAEIVVKGQPTGLLEWTCGETVDEGEEAPCFSEERESLNRIARELSLRIERWLVRKQQQEIRELMRHSNRLSVMGQLAAAVAHELNEPLTSILGFAQLASKNPRLPIQVASDLHKIVATSLHAREIVRKLLMYGGKMPQRESAVDVNKAVREGIGFFTHRLSRDRIELELDFSDDVGDIRADPGQLRQVVANLFLNAMQAIAKGGTITIRTARSGSDVLMSIRDTGCGMSPEIQDKIFIPFFTTKKPHRGTGLGLSVVLDIVKGMGGAIRVDSEPGIGTRVEVRLPVAPPSAGNGRSGARQ